MTLVFAHHGGIGEIGIFVVPALLAMWALRAAEKRARRKAGERVREVDDE